jgi:hypothetical protein
LRGVGYSKGIMFAGSVLHGTNLAYELLGEVYAQRPLERDKLVCLSSDLVYFCRFSERWTRELCNDVDTDADNDFQ